jgi:hypothetical protein
MVRGEERHPPRLPAHMTAKPRFAVTRARIPPIRETGKARCDEAADVYAVRGPWYRYSLSNTEPIRGLNNRS